MPNWTSVNITTDKNVIQKYMYENNGEKIFDFNLIIPMPDSLCVTSGSSNLYDIYYFISNRLTLHPKAVEAEYGTILSSLSYGLDCKEIEDRIKSNLNDYNEKNYEIGATLMTNFYKYHYFSWYEWRCANWGTKWNAADASFGDDWVHFDTAWSAPEPIFEKMCQENPTSAITFSAYYEGEPLHCEWENKGGHVELTLEEEVDWDDDEDYDDETSDFETGTIVEESSKETTIIEGLPFEL